jgi:hypothetical protein
LKTNKKKNIYLEFFTVLERKPVIFGALPQIASFLYFRLSLSCRNRQAWMLQQKCKIRDNVLLAVAVPP